MTLHDDEFRIDEDLVRQLVDTSFPEYAAQPIRALVASGSSNALFRLGEDVLVRLPRQPGGSATIDKEQRWLPFLAPRLPVAVPELVAVGQPGPGFPERWSMVRWLPGSVPDAPAREDLAEQLAATVRSLRSQPVTREAEGDPALRWYRAGPLADLDETMRGNLAACRDLDLGLDLELAERVWNHALTLPSYDGPPRWLHGDLLAENLLVADDRLVAVLDFGGLAVGDPTVDLVVAWEVLDGPSRRVFRDALAVDEATWLRGRAWALALALMTFPYYGATMPKRCADRLVMAGAVLADASTSDRSAPYDVNK